MSNELVKTARADRSSVKLLQSVAVSSLPRSGCRMMCPTGCLPAASCAVLVLLADRLLIRLTHPPRPSPRRACRASLRPPVSSRRLALVSSHPLIRYACPPRSACPPRFSCRWAGRYAYRSHLVMRSARPLLGVLTVILNAVAMGTVGCGAFVPRFHKLHLLSGASCVSLLQHGVPSFFLLFRFLSSCSLTFLVSISVEMSGNLVDDRGIFSCGIFAQSEVFLTVLVV